MKNNKISLALSILASSIAFNCLAQEPKTLNELAPQAIESQTPQLKTIDTVVGIGDEAIVGTRVAVHYSGWLYDPSAQDRRGKSFDSSLKRGPFTFPLGAGRVIKGWDQGVQGMKVGGKRTLIIPSSLAYGARGAGNGIIPPDADLIFDVELLNVIKPESEQAIPTTNVLSQPLKKIDVKKGNGALAIPGKNVTVHYTGWLFNAKAKNQRGEQFDSSKGKDAFTFLLGATHVIKGWDEGVAGMQVGGKRTLIIPSTLAYGERGAGNGKIPPNTDLIFDVELIKVK